MKTRPHDRRKIFDCPSLYFVKATMPRFTWRNVVTHLCPKKFRERKKKGGGGGQGRKRKNYFRINKIFATRHTHT